MNARQWCRDLGMGLRFAYAGGREGWIRMLLTAVGVGLGVALLLLTTSLPGAMAERDRRGMARIDNIGLELGTPASDNTVLVGHTPTTFDHRMIRGRLLEPEGDKAPLPPGLRKFPAPGDMVVSPALRELLDSDEGELLRERLPYDIVGTIGEQGLIGSQELAYYAGGEGLAERLEDGPVRRLDSFGPQNLGDTKPVEPDPVLYLLVVVVLVVLLMPVAVFVATAVRFGGERRDRRLAALRLVGSDSGMTRRIAAGETLGGALLGLVFGTAFFLVGRELAASFEVAGVSVFPSYLNPSPLLALLVAVLVPAVAVLVTLLALRGVVIEPLGVVRAAQPARRRLWWRLVLPLAGIGLMAPMFGQGRKNGDFNGYLVSGGVICLLVGVTALLPWLVEKVVARLGSGSVSWQLAVRRLQVSSGMAARMVNGVAVAVAGAIALHMLFTGVQEDYTDTTSYDVDLAQMQVDVAEGTDLGTAVERFEQTKGVRRVYAMSQGSVVDRPSGEMPEHFASLTIADCATLREVAKLPSCKDGDAFALRGGERDAETEALGTPGRKLYVPNGGPSTSEGGRSEDIVWTVPRTLPKADSIVDPTGVTRSGFLLTPGAMPPGMEQAIRTQLFLSIDDTVAYADDYVRNTAAALDPLSHPQRWHRTELTDRFDTIRTGLLVGATAVLVLIGASLLVSQLEQLRERRKLLSSLIAFGTRRRTLSLSVLWQTAIPIGLGLLLASVVGVALGAVLLKLTATPISVGWPSVLWMNGIGAGVVLVVTLLSLPPLLRLMRPDGLRTE